MDDVVDHEHEGLQGLKTRVYKLSDKVGKMELAQSKLEGRMDSAEGSIDRLVSSSATSDQVNSLSTLVSLKFDHLIEKVLDQKKQITWATRLVFLLFIGGVIALLYVGFTK